MRFKAFLTPPYSGIWYAIKSILFLLYLVLLSTFLLFSVFEFVPSLLDLVNLQEIRYYAQRAEYLPDPTLVFVPRQAERVFDTLEFRGDGYSLAYGIEVPPIRYHASYTAHGFRTNSSTPPFDILVIGDSYIELGESDDSTFTEFLRQSSGLSVLNLGRAWYGPPQYLEVFRRYGLGMKAQYALLSFFSGNDAEDTRQYMRWQRGGEGGDYYSFVVGRKNFFIRYLHAFRDTYSAIRKWLKGYFTGRLAVTPAAMSNQALPPAMHPDLAMIDLNGQKVPMVFSYWNLHATAKELLARDEWKAIQSLIAEFKAVALENHVDPIIVFIPTKAEVYGSLFSQQSGQRFLLKIPEQLHFETNSSEALEAVAQEQGVRIINLLPYFKELARQGKVLYYPFDTHWNATGRQAGSEVIAKVIKAATPLERKVP